MSSYLTIDRPKRVDVRTNAFEIVSLPRDVAVQYQVSFEPDFKGAAAERRRQYFDHLQVHGAPNIFSPKMLYDGGAVGFAAMQVAALLGPQRSFPVKLRLNGLANESDVGTKSKDPCILVKLERTVAVPLQAQDLENIYRGDKQGSEALINLLQLIIRQGTNNLYVTRGKAYYDMHQSNLRRSGGLEFRRGIWHSARPADNRLILMIDTVSTAFYPGGRLAEVIGAFLQERDIWRMHPRSQNWTKMVKYFKRLRVKVDVPQKSRNAIKTIKGFEPEGGLFRFDYNGQEMTVQEYYQMTYQVHVQYPKAPGVILKIHGDFKSVVPIEFCELVSGQVFRSKVPESFSREMVKFASLRPDDRSRRIMDAAKVYETQSNMAEMNTRVSQQPLVVKGNLYPAPSLIYEGRQDPSPRDGKWNIVDRRFLYAKGLLYWGIVNCASGEAHDGQLRQLVSVLQGCCQNHGMEFQPPTSVENCPQGSNISQRLDGILAEVVRKWQSFGNPEPFRPVIFVILPNSAADLRAKVKFWGDIAKGVQTQCIRSAGRDGIKKATDNQYVNNVLLKINARAGGINFAVSSGSSYLHLHPPPKEAGNNSTIIFGADVSHPGPGVWSKPSVTSIVFSTDKQGARYAAITEIQKPRVERIERLRDMVLKALNRYAATLRAPPLNIVFYRDGLSEGEFDTTASAEIRDIQEAVTLFVKGAPPGIYDHPDPARRPPPPKLTYIVVGKRHHALLFPNQRELDDGKGNCRAGVAVQEGITQPYRYTADFYLQSHAAIQGTSRSSHYIVLKDEIFTRWGPQRTEALQEYSFALCHMYAKATRSVSIPAPVYYADLVCQRGAFHLPNGTGFTFDEEASTSGSASSESFPLERWREEFKSIHKHVKDNMYFL